MNYRALTLRLALATVMLACVSAASGQMYEEPGDVQPPQGPPAEIPETAWEKPLPHVSFSVDYTLVSDYVWRGVNYSEYPGETPERPNHQFGVGVEVDLEEMNAGAIGFAFWGNSYSGYKQQGLDTPIIELDYVLYWTKEFADYYTTVETGLIWYTFPPVGGDAHSTQEYYVSLSFNDGPLFGCEDGVLNPYVYWGMDLDLSRPNQWIEAGISHDFDLGEYTSILEHVTVTPSFVIGVDHHYLHDFDVKAGTTDATTTVAFLNYGLSIGYDLSAALEIPEKFGAIGLEGFMNYSQAVRDALLDDEFYGGMTVSWAW
jgi:hypothetical protein